MGKREWRDGRRRGGEEERGRGGRERWMEDKKGRGASFAQRHSKLVTQATRI